MLLAAILVVTTGCGLRKPPRTCQPFCKRPEEVSIVQLIANPKAYDGKTVRIIGFLHLGGDERAIYLHNEDYLYGITKDSLSIDVTSNDVSREKFNTINHQYVICTARFVANMHGAAGSNSGALTNVTDLELWRSQRGATPPPLTPELATAAPKRSYVVIDHNPLVPGPEGKPVVAGDQVAFDVFFKQAGPNPVELGGAVATAYLRGDGTTSTQEEVAQQFASEVAAKHKEWDASAISLHHPTLGLGTAQYLTAFAKSATSEPLRYTQEDLDKIDDGSRVIFVLLNVRYKDLGEMHQFHLCLWRQANKAWHYCDVYNDVE